MESLARILYGARTTPKESAYYGVVALVVGILMAGAGFAVNVEPVVFAASALSVSSSILLISGWFAARNGRRWRPMTAVGFVALGVTVVSVGLLQEGLVGTVLVTVVGLAYVGKGLWFQASKEN